MDIFISHSNSDLEIARRLSQVLSAKGFEVFLAAAIAPGMQWSPLTLKSVQRCDVLVLIDSPQSRVSAWVQQEAGMVLALSSLLIPFSLDGCPGKLPGWLGGIQGVAVNPDAPVDEKVNFIVAHIVNRIAAEQSALPLELQNPTTVASFVLRTVLFDQFSGPEERFGAWSRQYDRYLSLIYGGATIPNDVSQNTSLTMTGMIVERLVECLGDVSTAASQAVTNAIQDARSFVLGSQHRGQGGLGRRSPDFGSRGERPLILDLRHTCWAIRTLLQIDERNLKPQIELALGWLAGQAAERYETDPECWTTAPLLGLINDHRLSGFQHWQSAGGALRRSVERDLIRAFDVRTASWIDGKEHKQELVAVDNALYVLFCLKDDFDLCDELQEQRRIALRALLDRLKLPISGSGPRGLPLFDRNRPEVGPTCQLLEILHALGMDKQLQELEQFVVDAISKRHIMPHTFSWHLIAALSVARLRERALT